MKPKPFWPLNHFTTPVAILLSPKARIAPIARTTSVQAQIQSQRCLGEGGLGRDQQGSAFKSNRLHIQHLPAIARAQSKIPSIPAFFRSSLMALELIVRHGMAHQDRYGLTLSTASVEAAE